jgi:outer membrane receptor protein involved in Fe transport
MKRTVIACAWAMLSASAFAQQSAPEDAVTVTGTREKERLVETPAAVGTIPAETVRQDRPTHPSQIMSQIPGVAVAVTNGEGHTTAIRQPFTTGPVYLYLEDGIPIRSTGFFNHNALYEVDLPQAGGIEVTRGPGTALYGSDAIGGIVNVLTRPPSGKREASLFGEVGGHGWWRLLGDVGGAHGANDAWRGDLNLTHTDGWRERTAYDRQGGVARWDRAFDSDAVLKTVLGFSHVDQQTGANSPLVESDYLNNPTRNYLPIAYRKVSAFRLSSAYERETGNSLLSLTPYIRDNSMNLLASYNLNNDPTIAKTQNQSLGLLAKWRKDFAPMRARLIGGVDLDLSPGGREEDAIITNVVGSGASRQHLSYTAAGRIYDYDVTYQGVSPYVHGEISPTERLRLTAGLRYDHLSYDFDNHIAAPVVVPPDGPSTFPTGTRIYGQAPDTDVTFTHTSPKFGATYALSAETHLFVALTHGFRVPSEGDLFRPSFGTSVAAAQAAAQAALALKPIKADQVEGGLRGAAGRLSYDLVLYDLKKRDDIVTQRDTATNFTERVNAGRTRHRGVELGVGAPLANHWRIDAALSMASHTYEDFVTSQGDFSGKHIEAAPRVLGNARLTWAPIEKARVQLEWVRVGEYWLDAANTAKYGGHDLYNVRANWPLASRLTVYGSITNVTNRRYADSAQISSSTPVFSPGLPRTLYAGLEAQW